MLAIDDMWRDHSPDSGVGPALGGVSLCMTVCFFGAIDARKEALEEGSAFGLDGRKISSVNSRSQ